MIGVNNKSINFTRCDLLKNNDHQKRDKNNLWGMIFGNINYGIYGVKKIIIKVKFKKNCCLEKPERQEPNGKFGRKKILKIIFHRSSSKNRSNIKVVLIKLKYNQKYELRIWGCLFPCD